jgi:hypothetical protein
MSLNDPKAVTAIVTALRQVHGDDAARTMLAGGMSLASLLAALLAAPMSNRDAVRLITRSLGDFVIMPDLGQAWHLKHVYARPGSFDVVDVTIATPDRMMGSEEVILRLPV